MQQKYTKKDIWNLIFVLPACLLFFVFIILPFVQGIPYSFRNWDGFSLTYEVVNFKNYINIFKDRMVLSSSWHTIQFTFMEVVFSNIFGLLFALGLKAKSKANNIMRTLLFMPFVISMVLASFIWSYLYSDVIAPIFGARSILGSTTWVMVGLGFISVWRDAGYCMVIYIAALNAIPESFYEAASLEGAKRLAQFKSITLPMIVPALTANVSLLLSWGLKVFDYPFSITGGGPGTASTTINLYIYNNIFGFYHAGYGQALAMIFTLVIFLLTTLVAKKLRSKEVEL